MANYSDIIFRLLLKSRHEILILCQQLGNSDWALEGEMSGKSRLLRRSIP